MDHANPIRRPSLLLCLLLAVLSIAAIPLGVLLV